MTFVYIARERTTGIATLVQARGGWYDFTWPQFVAAMREWNERPDCRFTYWPVGFNVPGEVAA